MISYTVEFDFYKMHTRNYNTRNNVSFSVSKIYLIYLMPPPDFINTKYYRNAMHEVI